MEAISATVRRSRIQKVGKFLSGIDLVVTAKKEAACKWTSISTVHAVINTSLLRKEEREWSEIVLAATNRLKFRGTAPQVLKVPLPAAAPANPKPAPVTYEPSTDTFRGTLPQVAKLAMRAIRALGWKLDNVNDAVGLVTFETGMTLASWSGVSGSLSIEEVAEHQFRVHGTAKQNVRGGQIAAFDLFGEAQGKVNAVVRKMRELALPPMEVAVAPIPRGRKTARQALLVLVIAIVAAGLLLLRNFNFNFGARTTEATLTTTIVPQDGSSPLPAGTKVEVLSHSDATARIRYSGRELVVSTAVLQQLK